jgi:hypothetical protein
MDPFTLLLGFAIGVAVTFLLIFVGIRIKTPVEKNVELVPMWSINELGLDVCGVVERISDLDLPAGSQLIVKNTDSVPPKITNTCELRIDPTISENFLIGQNRAFIFMGTATQKVPVLLTEDDDLLMRLRSEFNSRWDKAELHAEPIIMKDLSENVGHYTRIKGTVVDIKEFNPRETSPYSYILRVVDRGAGVDVLSKKRYTGEIEVVGSVRESKGLVAIDSISITEIK